ncbi:carboxylesterase family protein [Streptosporangium lutulentum]
MRGGKLRGHPAAAGHGHPLWLPRASYEGHGQYLATLVGCADPETAPACLRDKPVADLLAQPALPLPGYGNAVLPEDPAKVLQEGRFHRVPVLTGITRDEGTMFTSMIFGEPMPAEGYEPALNEKFGAASPDVLARYPLDAHDGPPLQAVAAIMSDLDWAWEARNTDRQFARHVPTFSYEFTDRTAPALFPLKHGIRPLAAHGSELSFLFGVGWESAPLTPEQRRLGDMMIDYWSRFAAVGDPNRPGLPSWKRVRPGDGTPYVQGLAPGRGGVGSFDRASAHNLAFWDGLAGRGTEQGRPSGSPPEIPPAASSAAVGNRREKVTARPRVRTRGRAVKPVLPRRPAQARKPVPVDVVDRARKPLLIGEGPVSPGAWRRWREPYSAVGSRQGTEPPV